ncbi:MAG: LysR family transcriptional regulator [Candidatus Lokiarchaeota archaeon]|nr:LysR family transcriptional regulator [Candidatus Lokiarchaeota archaeon]
MNLKIEYFENFITVCEQGSISAAAKLLHKSQGAISQQIALLEKELGDIKLFRRTLKGVELTKEGEILLKTSKKILDDIEVARKEIDEIQKTIRGSLTISASTIPGEHILPKLLIQFKKENPTANFEIISSDSYNSMLNLIKDKVELAATGSKFESSMDLKEFDFLEIAEEELVVIVPPDHDLVGQDSVLIKDLLKYPFISRDKSSGTRNEMEKIFKDEKISLDQLDIYIELASTESIITAVSEGNGWSIISDIAAEKAKKAGEIEILKLKTKNPPRRKFYVIRKKENIHSVFLEEFWKFIKKQKKL